MQPPAPPPTVLRAESHFVTAATRDIPLALTKAGRVEKAMVRYQLYIRTEVEARATDAALPECVWTLSTHIQRQLCFTSITGLFACTELSIADQADNQKGDVPLVSEEGIDGCNLTAATVVGAERQLSETLGATAQERFETDLKLSVIPVLTKTGVIVKRSP